MQIPEIHVEDPIERTVIKTQYGVRLTYHDGRVTQHLRETRRSAEAMVGYHRQVIASDQEWLVDSAELVERDLTITIGDWRESPSE